MSDRVSNLLSKIFPILAVLPDDELPGKDLQMPPPKPVNVQESLSAIQLPTNTTQNQLAARYVQPTIHSISDELLHQLIAKEAYWIWAAAGHPHGNDQEHWLQAETIVRNLMAVANRCADG